MEQRAMSYHSQGLARALRALQVLSRSDRPVGLAELSRELDLPKSTLIRLLAVMDAEGFVQREGDPPTYSIGHAVLEIAKAYRPADLVAIAALAMRQLAQKVGFTTNLGVLEGKSVLHLNVEEPSRALRYAASGSLDSTYCTGLGKLLLSAIPADELDAHLPDTEPFAAFTEHTITTRAGLKRAIEGIRNQGFSSDEEERNRGVTCLAVLIPVDDAVPISLSISAPSGELASSQQRDTALRELRASANALASDPRFVRALIDFGNKEIST